MPRTTRPLSDLVRDSEIEATVFNDHTIQIVHRVGRSARQRVVRIEERWEREGCLGRGAYGTVYKERCGSGSRQRVRAVKEINKSIVAGEEIDHTRELEAIAKFSHPRYAHCFVRSDGWFEFGDAVFITMEYLEHGDLQRYLTRPLPEAEAREITSQVLEGLKHMHDNRFIHRDLKPGNIMVVEEGPDWWVKIADFGISKRRHELTTSLQTQQLGTFAFAAPEAAGVSDDEPGSAHATALDMWSLGAVAFRMMTNVGAFPNLKELADYCSGRRGFPTARLKGRGISDHGQQFVESLMLLKPEKRPLVDQARQHPWIQVGGIPEAASPDAGMDAISRSPLSDTHNIGDLTAVSEPSALWSYIDQSEATISQRPAVPPLASNYRSPYVEDCSDDDDAEIQQASANDASPPQDILSDAPGQTRNEEVDPSSPAISGPDGQTSNHLGGGDTCVVCMNDQLLPHNIVKLGCGHLMCIRCMRKSFSRSLTDPQLMPPKCCTANPIPLKYVEDLFDNDFKLHWNRKFAEYSATLTASDSTTQKAGVNNIRPGDELPWREFPVVIVQDERKSPRNDDDQSSPNRPKRAVRFDDDFDTMSLDGPSDQPSDEGLEFEDEYLGPDQPTDANEGRGKGKGLDISLDEPPLWDTAYWKYMRQLEKAMAYIENSRRPCAISAPGEAPDEEWDPYIEVPVDDETLKPGRRRRRSVNV
ncbi:hypothetical protein OQA88_7210 [Cercophora sp. LCS_1]